jgi:hypothetical protein
MYQQIIQFNKKLILRVNTFILNSARINYISYKITMLDFALKYVKSPKLLKLFFYGENFPLHDAPLLWLPAILIFPTLLTC